MKNCHRILTLLLLFSFTLLVSCKSNKKEKTDGTMEKGTYGYDLDFLKKNTEPVELKNGDARVLISPEYQGRVMTSTAAGDTGKSFGWINYDLIQKGEIQEHINPVGGEERFWLGPEGGQYSIFFPSGSLFEFDDWQTPAFIDSEPWDLVGKTNTEAEFKKSTRLTNYSNFNFDLEVTRKITLLPTDKIKSELGIVFQNDVKNVGFTTTNQLKNTGTVSWEKESGLLSMWLLGMYNPSDEVTIIIPYKSDVVSDYVVKDDYFGKIPSDRLVLKDGIIFFKGDGKQRGKLGVPPQRAIPVLGSYDAANKILTVVKCEVPEGVSDYVNSAWELQQFPYKGDAINSYNDGPLEDGSQMGPFYELETSSQALALKPDETAVYQQSTFHFQGTEEELNAICQQLFNVTLDEVQAVF